MIYVMSPTGVATGGTELLQQLCYTLNQQNIEAKMYYIGEYKGSPVQTKFEQYYHNPYVMEVENTREHSLVVPEVYYTFLFKNRTLYNRMTKYFWWLSVDNYVCPYDMSLRAKMRDQILKRTVFNKGIHLVQSEYARLFVENRYSPKKENVRYLSDYLNRDYFQQAANLPKKDVILYNPKKGYEYTSQLKEYITEYQWIPLCNLSNAEMRALLTTSKVYVDFGNHPGKDRIPREACISGCCIITGKRGSANNPIDIPISDEFKFEDSVESFGAICKKITQCMLNYENETQKFEAYRERTRQEETAFKLDVQAVFGGK
jgi:hypothetical protein